MNPSYDTKKQSETEKAPVCKLSSEGKMALLDGLPEYYEPWVYLAEQIGIEGVEAVLNAFGGEKPHIPTCKNFWDNIARIHRNERMRRLFHPTSYGYAQLAREFTGFMGLSTLSERHVREIIHAKQRKYVRKKERSSPMKVPNQQCKRIVDLAVAHQVSQNDVIGAILSTLDDNQLQAAIAKASHENK